MTDSPAADKTDSDPRPVPASESWRELLNWRKKGQIEPNSGANTFLILNHDKKWKGVFVYDLFSRQVLMHRCPPFMADSEFRVKRLEHDDIVKTSYALEYDGLGPSVQRTHDAIKAVAKENRIHPVRDYFDALEWDGVERLDTWLRVYLGATEHDPNYLGPVGAKWLVAAVKRIYQPGAKFDHMLVLEGPQNIGKSFALRTLATLGADEEVEYFTDAIRLEQTALPETIAGLQGSLIMEFAELAALKKREFEDLKNWITIRIDQAQMKYESEITPFPRQFVLAGTTSEEWLFDPEYAWWFWSVKCREKIDIDRLRGIRRQLWAEAVHRYKLSARV